MAMTATAIRFADDEREWIQAFADFTGQTFSEVVRESVLERIEEAADSEALAEDDGKRYSMDEVMRMAMMSE